MKNGKYMLKISGCQMSFRDAETIAGQLERAGYAPCDDESLADIIIFQTCCVRETAERKIYGQINQLRSLKRDKPGLIVGMAGCLAQKDKNLVLERCPHVDFVLGPRRLSKVGSIVTSLLEERRHIIDVQEDGDLENLLPPVRNDKIRAYVNITYGCNNYCSYCIVPYVRGPEVSREPSAIVSEVKDAVRDGYREIMLLGQNVNTYGKDFDGKPHFGQLLKNLDQLADVKRIRYMTSHPRDFTEEMVETVKNSRNICEHFHLPIQSGSNRILKEMSRGYSREHYFALIEMIRGHIPTASITTDFIVGFPGETEENFLETIDLVKQIRFDAAYTFIFSPRAGTKAATLPEQIPSQVKKDRLHRLNEVQNQISLEINQSLIGHTLEVLIEGPSKTNKEVLSGRTRTNKLVHFNGSKDLVGRLIDVKIQKASTWTLWGVTL